MKHTLILAVFALCALATSGAQRSDSVRIHFHQSRSQLDSTYKNNGENLSDMLRKVNSVLSSDSIIEISEVKVVGAASPEGSVAINRKLSEKRAEKIFDYLSERIDLPDSVTSFTFIGRDWAGLLQMVRNDTQVPFRNDVIGLLERILQSEHISGSDSEANLTALKKLHYGVPYTYMYSRMFPELRASRLYLYYRMKSSEMPSLPAVPDYSETIDSVPIEQSLPPIVEEIDILPYCETCRPFYMGLKTNLLYDALALPSVGVEFYIGKGWSVIADWTYGWWDKDNNHRYWRAYGGDVGIRKWFGKAAAEKPLTGHHLGIYGGVVTYDFEFGGKGHMGGLPGRSLWDRCNFMAGLEYGYSLPIARRLNLDFSIGIGYLGGKVVEYVPKGNAYIWQSTKTLHWFGPTKAEISLVWLIGCDNYNRKKGGNR